MYIYAFYVLILFQHALHYGFQWLPSNTSDSHVCSECGARFSTAANRNRHERKHRGLYPYHCDHCGKGVASRCELHAHLASMHGVTRLKLACQLCGKTFTRKSSVKAHVKLVHPETLALSDSPSQLTE